eukprot:CAMPEP_0196664494 /NCGR_PEP_ID=MMETSP1086-20130531/57380_1 /TAXON_ID=77921 /ORGANISM="Cyanoptyche  gloeocystis , Strain SAG4.97" /LENGTH=163 /DNA_ID=CAMNT_0042000829 /DNA_START=55 /DNA_END=546 /DNA_ORIENTATION=+
MAFSTFVCPFAQATSSTSTKICKSAVKSRPFQRISQRQNAPNRSFVVRSETAEKKAVDSLEIMRRFSEQYAQRSGTYFCVDLSVTAVVIKGLAEHKDQLGAPLCPCRHYDDKAAEAADGFWNCPCVPMRERKECHCMLFLTSDNDYAGTEQKITLDEVKTLAQ